VSGVEEGDLEQDRVVGLLQKEVANLREAKSRLAGESTGEQQSESQAQLAQETRLLWDEQARSGEAMKRVLEELGGLQEAQMEFEEFRKYAKFVFHLVVNFVIVSLSMEMSCLAFSSADRRASLKTLRSVSIVRA
jgi:hypothetical protein